MERFTFDQIQEYRDAFVLFDSTNKGYILENELRDMLKSIGYNPTDYVLERMLVTSDLDGDCKLDFDEFMHIIDQLESEEKNEKEARAAFNAFDFMGRGFIPANDIKEALMFLMVKSTEHDQKEIMKHFKLDVNRRVYFNEFKNMVTIKK